MRRPRKRRIVAATLLLAVLLGSVLLWSRREPIARGYIDRALAARGVEARYRIGRFGVSRQRLEALAIGDPRAPDLTADWAEIELAVGGGGPRVRAITAHGVRLRGRLIDGKLSLGALDRLLPAPSAAPFALPDLIVDLRDARMRLATPFGLVGLALDGRGNLAGGFSGRVAAVSRGIGPAGCRAAGATAFLRVATHRRRPEIDGPVRAARLACGGAIVAAPRLHIAAALAETLGLRRLRASLEADAISRGGIRAASLSGTIAHDAPAAATPSRGNAGRFDLLARDVRIGGDGARAVRLSGTHKDFGRTSMSVGGERSHRFAVDAGLRADGIRAAPARLAAIEAAARGAAGSPAGPLATALAAAIAAAGRDAAALAHLRVEGRLVEGRAATDPAEAARLNRTPHPPPRATTLVADLRVDRLSVAARSGARLQFAGTAEAALLPAALDPASIRTQGVVTASGGGLPRLRVVLRQPRAGGPLSGEVVMAPFAAEGARLALTPVRFARQDGAIGFATVATLDGPVADGRVDRLRLPIEGRWSGGRLRIGERCVPLEFGRLEIAGLVLAASRLPLCPTGGALIVRGADGRLGGGGAIVAPRLAGRIGKAPATIAAARLGLTLGRPGFAAEALAIRIGAGETVTRLDVPRLRGEAMAGGIGGTFTAAAGNIGAVPLLLSQGSGDWRLAAGVLTLAGHLRVADRAASPRFNPLESDDVRLRLAGGRIAATGRLVEPRTRTGISDVTLHHDLSTGIGDAVLAVPGIRFGDALQPEALTPLTLGVVANVRGLVSGRGEIGWTPAGATSTGTFRTDALALAAAFGPVTGVKGEIHFSDLLALATPPGQIVTIAEVNPGVAVTEGVVRYQLLPGQRMQVESGRWPFSGGELLLDPTLLDFGRPSERRMTFRVVGMDAARFVQQFQLKNVALTGTFDGVLPMLFDAGGGRIVGGRMAVRRGGGTLAYVGEVSNAQLGMFARLAFDALKSMRYDALAIELDGALDGELISRVLFNGTNETPKEAKGGLLAQLTGLPFRFNITIRAPFRGLLNSAQSLNDPRAFIAQALPKPAPVQPQESETVP